MRTVPEVLLVDDSPADTDLMREVLSRSKQHFHISVVCDGMEALAFLRRAGKHVEAPPVDLVVLDLNLPLKSGRDVLAELKSDAVLAKTPVAIFTTSEASSDINRCYELGANCYLKKPGNLPEFTAVVESMADFWLGFVRLPPKEKR